MTADRLKSESVVIQSPTSYAGITRRILKIQRTDNAWVRWLVLVPVVAVLLLMGWVFASGWYLVFGLFMVPWRLIRRGGRKRKREALRHRETLHAIGKQGADD